MNDITVTKEFTFDCAHMLTGHKGLCQNLHGHTYKLQVTAKGVEEKLIQDGPSEGMVCDFKDLKNIVQEIIIDNMDHAFIYDGTQDADTVEMQIAKLLESNGKKTCVMQARPTAENMAMEFLSALNIIDSIEIVKIRLYETPTSYAEAFRY